AGVPIIFRQMRMLRREGVTAVTVLAGHRGDQLAAPLAEEARALGLSVDVRVEAKPLGTAGCLSALGPVDGDTLVIYGDMLFDIALTPLRAFHRAQDALITVVAHPNDHPRTSDLVRQRDGLITAVLPREAPRAHDERNLVPAGIYLARPDFFARIPAGQNLDMMAETLSRIVADWPRAPAYTTHKTR